MMGHDSQKKWFDIVNKFGTNQTQDELEDCIERFLLLFMEEDISLDIKEWLSEIKKPRNMSVQDFVQRLNHLNDLIDYTPVPDPINYPGMQTPRFSDAEISRIVRNSVLQAGKNSSSSKSTSLKLSSSNKILYWFKKN
jgi:hypothetical protein